MVLGSCINPYVYVCFLYFGDQLVLVMLMASWVSIYRKYLPLQLSIPEDPSPEDCLRRSTVQSVYAEAILVIQKEPIILNRLGCFVLVLVPYADRLILRKVPCLPLLLDCKSIPYTIQCLWRHRISCFLVVQLTVQETARLGIHFHSLIAPCEGIFDL